MILKAGQICPYKNKCKYHNKMGGNNYCHGTNPDRKNDFICSYINDEGQFIEEGISRSIHDITGKMEFINED